MSSLKSILNLKYISNLLSDHNLSKKASLNAMASALDYGARLIVGFLVQPIMVSGLGDFYYGVWQVLLRLVGYITPASGRPTQALKMTLANRQTIADVNEKRQYVGSTLIVWAMFLPIMASLGGLLSWYSPYWIKSPAQYFTVIRLASAFLILNLILTNLVNIPESVLEGENLGYKRMGLSALLVISGGALTWLAVWLKTGIVGVAAAAVTVTLVTGGFYITVVRAYDPWFGVAKPSIKAVRQFLGLSWWFMAWNLIMNLMTASDVVILGILMSVETVTNFSLSKYAPETLISIVAIIAYGIAPGLGGIIGSGDLVKASHIRGEIMALTWLIVTSLGSTILSWNRSFVGLWVGPQHFVGVIPQLFIVLTVMQFVLIRNDGNVIDLSLRLERKVIMGGISVSLSIITAIILVYYFKLGIVGLSIGLIAGRLILSIGYPVLVGRLLNISFISQIKRAVRPVLITVLLFALANGLDNLLLTNSQFKLTGWVGLGFEVGLTFLVFLGSAFFAGLSAGQQKDIMNRIKIVLNLSS
jgi:O-antigen/teichoic acid export membrane protein